METFVQTPVQTHSHQDLAAHLSSQLLGCTSDLQTIGRVLRVLDDGSLVSDTLPKEVLTSLDQIVGHLRRLGHLTQSLSGSDDSVQLFSLAPLDMKDLLEEVTNSFRALGADGRLQICYRAANPQVWWGQSEQLKMVLDSLISPLLNYAAPRSLITITLEEYSGYRDRDNSYLRVLLANPHAFIRANEVEQLFIKQTPEECFNRLSAGLNLHMSRRLIEIQGGQLEAEAGPNGGLTFWFTLPQVEYAQKGDINVN